MASRDSRKQTLYFPVDMLEEIHSEAKRQDRTLSWLIQQAWKISKADIQKTPGSNDFLVPGEAVED